MDVILSIFGLIVLILFLVGWISCPLFGSNIGRSFGKSMWGMIYGLAFGPIGLVIMLLWRINAIQDESQVVEPLDM